jgi:outer membrane receptor for ferrienterochelin and colicins
MVSQSVPGVRTFLVDLPTTTDRFGLRAQESLDLGGGSRLAFSLASSWFRDEAGRDRRDSPVDETRTRRLYNQAEEVALTIADGDTRTWVTGVRLETESFDQRLERTLPDLSRQEIQELEPLTLTSVAAFGQLGWGITEALMLMPGARAELHDRYGTIAAPRLAVAHRAPHWLTVRSALGRGFRAPSAKEYGFEFDHSAIGYRVIGNPNLEPETSWGLSGDLTARSSELRVRAGAFYNWIDDLIATAIAPEQPVPGVTDYTYSNVADARTAGVDAGVRATLHPSCSLEAGYAYLWTKDSTTSGPLPNRPPHTVTLGAHASLGVFDATLRYRWVAAAYAGTVDQEELRSAAFGVLDARLSARMFDPLEAFVGVLNAADVARDPFEPGDTRPALGRQFYVGFRGSASADE